ncbi:MAG TPA: SDR family oxidoreductase [Myxococcota bacterium]
MTDDVTAPSFSAALDAALLLLQQVADDRAVLVDVDAEKRQRLQQLCGAIARPDLKDRKKLQKALLQQEHQAKKAADDDRRKDTGIRQLRAQPVFITPQLTAPIDATQTVESAEHDDVVDNVDAADADGELHHQRICYVCKQPYQRLHHFYDQLCPSCGDVGFSKRSPQHDLHGRVAVVTGARVKIGYHAAIMLLRNGADVVVTTRFPVDAAARYAREPDFAEWGHRLQIWGLDLRHTPSVDATARQLTSSLPRLDFIIHNACQTVRRPPGFYEHLLSAESSASSLSASTRRLIAPWEAFANDNMQLGGASASAALSQLSTSADAHTLPVLPATSEMSSALASIFPSGALDADLQQVDLRTHNSWRTQLGDVPVVELLEVLLVNAAAPFVLTSKLLPLLRKDNVGRDRHVVNVSAMEGQFYRRKKTDKHPHTNMAKAALNMLTRTSAAELVKDGIWMNAVDTGWVTDEDPAHIAERKVIEHRFSPPLDIVDGAARIVDPIFAGLATGVHSSGIFFKDYAPAPW